MATNLQQGRPILVDEANPSIDIGAEFMSRDGRKYRYARFGATGTVGSLYQGPAEVTGNQSRIVAAAAVGATEVTTTDTVTVTANQYAGGWLVATSEAGTGNGYYYEIKSHPAATAAGCTFTLTEPIQVAFSAATQIDLVANPYNNIIVCLASATSAPVGVCVNDVTNGNYGWIQTWGPGVVLNDATAALGVNDGISSSNATAGSVEFGVARQPNIGYALTGIAQSENGLAFLRIS